MTGFAGNLISFESKPLAGSVGDDLPALMMTGQKG